MKSSQGKIAVVLAGVALAWCPSTLAQAPPGGEEATPPVMVSVSFPGGTLSEYVAALRDNAGNANIVLANEKGRQIELPPIELRSVSLGAALRVVEGETWLDEHTLLRVDVEKIDPSEDRGSPVYKVWVEQRGRPSAAETEVEVWSVAGVLAGGFKAEDVLTAVETAVGLLEGGYPQAEIRFHEATGVVVARGEKQQLKAIDRAINGLRESLQERRAAEREASAVAQVEELEAMMQARARELEELRIGFEGAVREREALRRAEAEASDEVRHLKEVVRDLQTRLEGQQQ